MASQDSTNSADLIVGSLVSFTSAGVFYEGTVYSFDAEYASFGIDDVSCTKLLAGALSSTRLLTGDTRLEGLYQFFLKDIQDLRVIRVPSPKPTTNTTERS
ncbi:unnamed protein product [Thlaspi arvense]|uniref:Lsm14-like N-terminal domain-containing protein n=1 Tax=Thlaspi arvense TaxID=13288 RepID=A0AAU9SJH6_THLAR|nr:unnamed protein product [Thlaspi arvense]